MNGEKLEPIGILKSNLSSFYLFVNYSGRMPIEFYFATVAALIINKMGPSLVTARC